MLAYLGTNNALEVEQRIASGIKHALLIYEAMAYQISKENRVDGCGLGSVQAIVLTGGLANSKMLVDLVKERVMWIAPILVFAGQFEMVALAKGALRVPAARDRHWSIKQWHIILLLITQLNLQPFSLRTQIPAHQQVSTW